MSAAYSIMGRTIVRQAVALMLDVHTATQVAFEEIQCSVGFSSNITYVWRP